ncbi:zinc-binding dehydrogenase [Lentilactobacillus diolivorans]|uniref:zinc-binding dehydrogenase n=1 Tax=Lentilactobacillus diolivorans TaxID=179838 RepID=UPI002468E299|nr:zinc-binding dehydrogenase [Lentilactobacillus diolivorans]MDH5107020.1 zinc-binding dehydrogenase [Lentilactobacillus diolivorans]
MQALVVPDPSAQTMEQLQWQERPMPNLGPTEVLIKTPAVGLNPVDFKLVAAGNAAWQYPHTLGLDTAGIVEAVGAEVTNFRPGERVCGHANLANNGTFAEYVSLPAAAASLCAGLTAYQALLRKANLNAAQTVLIHAGAGGVGSMAIQLAKAAGKTVFTTVSQAKQAFVAPLHPDAQIDYHHEDVTTRIQDLTQQHGVDLLINTIGHADADLPRLAYNGQLVCVLATPDHFPSNQVVTISKLDLGGAHRSGNPAQVADLGQMTAALLALVQAGKVDPLITQVLHRDQLVTGLQQLQAGQVVGKLVVTFDAC